MIEQRQAATETAVSAPGKVLLAGGYLVLDRDYTGTVCALDARIHVVVQQQSVKRRPSAAETQTEGLAQLDSGQAAADGAVGAAEIPPALVNSGAQEEAVQDTVTVKSPQFVDAVWKYKIQRSDHGGGVRAVQCDDGFVMLMFPPLFFFAVLPPFPCLHGCFMNLVSFTLIRPTNQYS